MNPYVQKVLNETIQKNVHEKEFIQAVTEVFETLNSVIESDEKYEKNSILERIVEPERVIQFRVAWIADDGSYKVNRGFRVQFNSAIGPYKGGLRFHPSVNLSIIKFLGFEQIFKNSLTTLPMGGGKGGSDFDPAGKSDNEIMRFCQSFMTELQRHIGQNTDIPAGDIGVGGREVGYLFGQYKRLRNEFTGVLTGKGRNFGGSLIRPEATGFGAVYFTKEMLTKVGDSFLGKRVALSGYGNVTWGTAIKAIELGAIIVSISGSDGMVTIDTPMTAEMIDFLLQMRASKRRGVAPFAEKFADCTFYPGQRPWSIKCDIAIPCATQNELNKDEAEQLVANGCICCCEASNMGCTAEAVAVFQRAGILFGPGKAVNAGGVAVSGLEMTQNTIRLSWGREEVDAKLKDIMKDIHDAAYEAAEKFGMKGNYIAGANIAGFLKVADAMIAQGLV